MPTMPNETKITMMDISILKTQIIEIEDIVIKTYLFFTHEMIRLAVAF